MTARREAEADALSPSATPSDGGLTVSQLSLAERTLMR